jgi:hypothetical protein
MTERQKETKFLKSLILSDDSELGRQLQERIKAAEKDERCIRGAVGVVGLVALMSLSGLGYSAVFVPPSVQFSSYFGTKICCALGLGSTICVAIFLGYLFFYRAISNRVYEECRRFLRAALECRLKQSPLAAVEQTKTENLSVYRIETRQSQDRADLLRISKVS